jgi:peptidoglycan-N-acetylglucosamine deacetylase
MRHGRNAIRKVLSAARRATPGSITHVATQERVAALTFDDGPDPEFTPQLLELLGRHGARATFFMIGEKAHRHPDLVRAVAGRGHEVANHSWDHPVFPSIGARARRAQIRACAKAIAPYGQRIFRPPHGYQNLACRLDALWLRHRVVGWSVAVDDWCSTDAPWMAGRLVSSIRPGSIILLHDGLCDPVEPGYLDRRAMLDALEISLERLKGQFRFVTVSELLRAGRRQTAL